MHDFNQAAPVQEGVLVNDVRFELQHLCEKFFHLLVYRLLDWRGLSAEHGLKMINCLMNDDLKHLPWFAS